jgi:nitroreductase
MDLYESIKKRRSIRSFLDKEVEFEKIGNILDAARLAPSAGNLQDWKFILVYKKETREQIAALCPKQEWVAHAPVIIVVCSEIEQDREYYGERGEQLYAIQNAAAATENLLLAATAEGLGSCWVGAFNEPDLKKLLGIPGSARPLTVIGLGYYEGLVDELPRKRLEDITFFHQWGNRTKDMVSKTSEYHTYVSELLEKGKDLLQK